MFYYLPNKRPVDVEGAVDAMLDDNQANRYFLDVTTGAVGRIGAGHEERRTKRAAIQRERSRYRELPRASEAIQQLWCEELVRDLLAVEDAPLSKRVGDELRAHGLKKALALLQSSDDYWIVGWHSWAGDHAFEDLGVWLMKKIHGVTSEFKGCDDCAICRAGENGAGLEELLDAFEEQRHIDEDELPGK